MANRRNTDGFGFALYGFTDVLEGKTVHFVGPHPMGNVCVYCGGLHRLIKLSRCFHAFCVTCCEAILRAGEHCPVDGQLVSFSTLTGSRLDDSAIAEYTVRCLNALHGCPFEGSLFDLEQHVLQPCPHKPVTCRKCGEQMPSSQYEDHRVACETPKAATCFPGEFGKERSEKEDGVAAAIDCLSWAFEATPEVSNFAADSSAMDQTAPKKPQFPPDPDAGVVTPALQRPLLLRTHHDELLKGEMTVLASAQVCPECSRGGTSGTDRRLSATSQTQSVDAREVSQKKKSPTRPTTLALGPRRTPKLTAAALNAALANTALTLRPNENKAEDCDMLSSLSGALRSISIMGGTSDASAPPQAKTDEGGRNFFTDTAGGSKLSTVTTEQISHEPETDKEGRRRGEWSAQLDIPSAESNKNASEPSAAVGSSEYLRVYKTSIASQADGAGESGFGTTGEEVLGAAGGGGVSEPDPSLEARLEVTVQENLQVREARRAIFTFSGIGAAISALETETAVTMKSEMWDVQSGYTFHAECRFRGLGSLTMVSFGLSFCAGEYDNLCRWPFRMTVFFEVLHPQGDPRYMKFELRPGRAVPAGAFRKPVAGTENPAVFSQEYAWVNVVKAGFFADDTIRFQMWFE